MRRHPRNPVLSRLDIPGRDVSSVFNPGAIAWEGQDLLVLRVQTRGRETLWWLAEGHPDRGFRLRPEPLRLLLPSSIYHAYDARLSLVEGRLHAMFAADTDAGCKLGLARFIDLDQAELIALGGADEDSRNGVLFPERIGGRYLRLERPNLHNPTGGPATGSTIVLAESSDLVTWRRCADVMSGRWRFWDELIGSGPPPLKTRAGWLHVYHGVATHFQSVNIYQAGVVLLDLEDPSRVLRRTRENILEPRELYETTGQVPNVVFPSGLIADEVDAEGFAAEQSPLRIYYGAADTAVGVLVTTVAELLAAP